MNSAENKAVFLSYASQDAEAVERIAEALRAAGVEVWFDKDELVGGDAWDAKIRGQIAACALFVPVISAATQARHEGYFRLEWKLAAQRTHMMSGAKVFLLPVVIDETRDAEAHVPAEFRAVQWTRLAGGETTPAFVARVQKLLGGPSAVVSPTVPVAQQSVAVAPAPKSHALVWAVAALGAVVLGLIGFLVTRPSAKDVGSAAKPVAEMKSSPAAAASPATVQDDKSIAVLPFTNLSQDKDNEYFADGIHFEVNDRLQALRDLRVVSLQSVLSYRGTTKPSPEISRELGVAYLLIGSVRRAGNDVRVSVQLVDARSDTQIWALPPETHGVANVFAVQTAIAQATANALKAVLSPSERAQLAEKSTENMAAYELFLRSRELTVRDPFSPSSLRQNAEWLRQAVKLDPKFARAWTRLSRTLIQTHVIGIDGRQEVLAEAKAALDKAMLLAPESLDTQLALAGYYYQGLGDYERALAQCAALAVLHPNNPLVTRMPGLILRRQGNWPAALENLRKAVELDRGDASSLRSLTQTLRVARRWDEALIEQRRLVDLVKSGANEIYYLGETPFLATGSTKEMAECIQGVEKELGPSAAVVIDMKKRWAVQRGELAEAIRLDELQPYFDDGANLRSGEATRAAISLMAAGKTDAARLRLGSHPEELRKQVRENPDDIRLLLNLARVEVVLGDGKEGLRHAEKAMALAAKSDQWIAAGIRAQLVGMLAWAGQIPRALEELRLSLQEPGGARVHEVRHGPWYLPLRGDPRFEAMLEEPKNNEPLF